MDTQWLSFSSSNTTATHSPAAVRVLGVGELVEHILVHLPIADIVRCRRVSQKFYESVTYSKGLRQKLFLELDDDSERVVNPLVPSWFNRQEKGYRDDTVAARIDLWPLWQGSLDEVRPLWDRMLIAKPPIVNCVIPVGHHLTIYHKRYYPDGMTFGDLERALIAAYEIRKGRKSIKERLDDLSEYNSVLMLYWR